MTPAARLVLPRLVVRHWAAGLGTSPRRLGIALLAGMIGVALVGHEATASWTPPPGGGAEAILMGLAVAVFAGAAAYGIVAGRWRDLPPSLAFLRALPVTATNLRRATALPAAAVGGLAGAALGPPAARLVAGAAGYGAGHAIGGVVVLTVAGIAAGGALLGVSDRVLARRGGAPFRQTFACLAWLALVGASVSLPPAAVRAGGWPAGLLLIAPLVWPLPWWALVEPSDIAVLSAVLATAVVWRLAARLQPRGTEVRPDRARAGVRAVRVHPDRSRVLVVALLTAVRLRRQARSLEALVVAGFLATATVLGAGWLARRLAAGGLSPDTVALLGSQVACGFGVLVRGLSQRRRSAEAALGISAGEHVAGAYLSVVVLAVLVSVPALLVLPLLFPVVTASVWFAALLVHAAVAVTVSVALTPRVGDGGAEAAAVMSYAVVDALVVRSLLLVHGPLVVPAGLATIAALVATGVLVEKHRRS